MTEQHAPQKMPQMVATHSKQMSIDTDTILAGRADRLNTSAEDDLNQADNQGKNALPLP